MNGVSRLHGKVSRQLFEPLFARWPGDEVPVGHVTNGVHMPSWDSVAADDLWTEACGKNRWLEPAEDLENGIRRLSNSRLWQCRNDASKSLVEYARDRLSGQLSRLRRVARCSGGGETSIRSECFDTGLCAALRDLQETEPASARPRATASLIEKFRASGATHHRWEGASGGPSGAGFNPGMGAFHPAARDTLTCDIPQ